jgi:O-antigen ligase
VYAAIDATLALAGVTPSSGYRLLGIEGDPGTLGLTLLAGIAGSLVLSPWVRTVTLLPITVGIMFTLTRGVWIAAAGTMAVALMPRVHRRGLRVAIVAGLIVISGVMSIPWLTNELDLNPFSIDLRLVSWTSALDLIRSQPIVGVGWGGEQLFSISSNTPLPFNLWLNVAVTTGVVGALLLTVFLIGLLRALVGSMHPVARAGLAYCVGMLMFSLGATFMFGGSSVAIDFFLLTGAAIPFSRWQQRKDRASASPGSHINKGAPTRIGWQA